MTTAKSPTFKSALIAVVAVVLGLGGWLGKEAFDAPPAQGSGSSQTAAPPKSTDDGGAAEIARLFAAHQSDTIVDVSGTVQNTLRDDTDSTPHQKWILELSDGKTVLVSHSLKFSDHVPLQRGDRIRIKGEYEWNNKGGVLHWTHYDPAGRHADGWVEHAGKRYGVR